MSDFDAIYDDLIASRGGRERFSASSLAVARQLATLLSEPLSDASAARSIVELEKLLPVPVVEQSREWDLKLLSDHDLGELARISAIATGAAEPEPAPAAPAEPARSHRQLLADDAALLLDEVAPAGEPHVGLLLTERRRLEVAALLGSTVYPFRAAEIWPHLCDTETREELAGAVGAAPAPPAAASTGSPTRPSGVPGAAGRA